jgi:hypothetical protein
MYSAKTSSAEPCCQMTKAEGKYYNKSNLTLLFLPSTYLSSTSITNKITQYFQYCS